MEMANLRYAVDGTADMVARGQNYGCILNSLVLCAFSHAGYVQNYSANGFPGITAKHVIEWLRLATGMDIDFPSLMLTGERIYNLKHLINLKRGLKPSSDDLPERFKTRTRQPGPSGDHLPPVEKMVKDYYRVRKWDSTGKIDSAKLQALGLKEL
jgi:aldehyde:ferredoxin oxidoreductase